jgi:deoxyribodipyrimidine photo-lyase
MKIVVVWFRRDLRFEDNTALIQAYKTGFPILPVFIFDKNILSGLPEKDPRVSFIFSKLSELNNVLSVSESSFMVKYGDPLEVWHELVATYDIVQVFFNKDYEPYSIRRDMTIKKFLEKRKIRISAYKDQVIFEEDEIVKDDGKPYTIFTPYKNKWLKKFQPFSVKDNSIRSLERFVHVKHTFPSLSEIGFQKSFQLVKDYNLQAIGHYAGVRDFPAKETTFLGPHLRFGTVCIRKIIAFCYEQDKEFLSELIWREFFMQILWHFPNVIDKNFKPQYNGILWRNNEEEFKLWCQGNTGFPLVDAGMRQLNETGYMHNRVRMVTASFLCKHLLIDWSWGEAYFAQKLLDYELSSNNGNWQWAAGTGCDAAPYFRVFNPTGQMKKFDKDFLYTRKWVPEVGSGKQIKPMVDHKLARERAINTYKKAILSNKY